MEAITSPRSIRSLSSRSYGPWSMSVTSMVTVINAPVTEVSVAVTLTVYVIRPPSKSCAVPSLTRICPVSTSMAKSAASAPLIEYVIAR